MRHPGLFGFLVTTAVLVPAALVRLDAGPAQQARLFAPKITHAMIDGARVAARLNKGLVDEGGQVNALLRADRAVKVAVVVVGTGWVTEVRTPNPPVAVARENVELAAGEPFEVPVKLRGARHGTFGNYTLFVMSPSDADHFERWRRATDDNGRDAARRGASSDVADLFESLESRWSPIPPVEFTGTSIARLEARTRPDAYPGFALHAPETARANEAFVATVEIKNPSSTAAHAFDVGLSAPSFDDAYLADGQGERPVMIDPSSTEVVLAPGETRRVEFHVTGARVGTLALEAYASCDTEGDACRSPYHDGAFEAVSIEGAGSVAAR